MNHIAIPRCFRRDEPPDRTAERIRVLVDRLASIEKAYWNDLNDDGRRLVRRAGFSAFIDGSVADRLRAARGERIVAVDGDTCV